MTVAPRNILVTGASGFVGRHLMTALAAAYPCATLLAPPIDVQDEGAVEAAVRAGEPDVCVHLAAMSAVAAAEQAPHDAWQVNLHGTLHLAWALWRHAPHCQMLFISSADAYGASFRAGLKLDESAPLVPMNRYAETKAAADVVLGGMATRGMRVVRLRPFNHIGPGQTTQFAVAAFARQIARIAAGLQPPVIQVGDLDTWRDFLDVRDVCSAYVACIARRDILAPGTVLNLASGQARRIGDVLAEMAVLAGVAMEIEVDASRVRVTEIRKACGNAARARELLDWMPVIPWEQTLRDVLDDWRGRIVTEAGEADRGSKRRYRLSA
jgi:GDP-4-dehydro-6-deoxy-D-mannose reductase